MPKKLDQHRKKLVKVVNDRGRLRLYLPVFASLQFYGINQKRITLNLVDTPENRKIAQAKADAIMSDLALERFDKSLVKYGLGENAIAAISTEVSILELWKRYQKYKSATAKPKTIEEYQSVAELLSKLDCSSAIALRSQLIETKTHRTAKRSLMQLSAAHNWGVKHGLVTNNPFEGMSQELGKYSWESNPLPNPFTQSQKEEILDRFESNQYYCHYSPFVQFLFLTGCRPSEAVGIQWKHFDTKKQQLTFETSITQVKSKPTRVHLSKNNKSRTFPINTELHNLLVKQYDHSFNSDFEGLIFPSANGGIILYSNFSKRAWDKIVDPIKPGTTPYCCRDTFISEQIAKGIPIAVIARWVDNSVTIIEKYYLGNKAIEHITPL